MPVDPELLEILVCPESKGELEVVELPEELRARLADRYREHFRDEEPVVTEGLYSPDSGLLYPIVSDIPVMLVDEALPGSVIGREGPPGDGGGPARTGAGAGAEPDAAG